MKQRFKSIYWADYTAENPAKRSLTLAFGEKDADLYQRVQNLTSLELRDLLGHNSYSQVQRVAEQEDRTVNSYCLRRLKKNVRPKGTLTTSENAKAQSHARLVAVQATFRGGMEEPLHKWYPYLEGYSPQFVEDVLREFAPEARRILDPFAGVGTTPLTVARMGGEALYCEINPFLQQLTQVKTVALTLKPDAKLGIADRLHSIAGSFTMSLATEHPNADLDMAYADVFGESRFFDAGVYQDILRARTFVDRLACEDPVLAQFVEQGILSSLVPASRLIRRGDLRFKTDTEAKKTRTDFCRTVSGYLRLFGEDLTRISAVQYSPLLVCADAKEIRKVPSLSLDAIVTSPPYLNGTNYFRNTKVELWFLRALRSSADLTAFRFKSVTAGINDVTKEKAPSQLDAGMTALVHELERKAYDKRIPWMVSSYFTDMARVFDGLARHLRGGGRMIIDIGDSRYGGVHVATDVILTSMLERKGFHLVRQVNLRRRNSRDGSPLQQVLLVFERTRRDTPMIEEDLSPYNDAWRNPWARFKINLPHQHGTFAKRNWGHPLHSLCSYQGKMKPALAHWLVRTFVPPGGNLLDPFAGVGTIPFEAALFGARSWSFDISPAALSIARAKLQKPVWSECEMILQQLENALANGAVEEEDLASAREIRFNGPLCEYFHEKTLREILIARRFFRDLPPRTGSESVVFASLIHILHGNRPYALSRRSHPITPFSPSGSTEYRAVMPRLRDKVARSLSLAYPPEFQPGKVFEQDVTGFWPQEIGDLDAVITSPPFFDSTRFYLANWMRLWFCGWDASDFRIRPMAYIDERQKRTFTVYEPFFRQARERLKSGGLLVLHLGKSRKCDMAEHLQSIAQKWFKVQDVFSESVRHCESHGIADKGAVTDHQFMVLS